MEVNCTELSPSVRDPWIVQRSGTVKNLQAYNINYGRKMVQSLLGSYTIKLFPAVINLLRVLRYQLLPCLIFVGQPCSPILDCVEVASGSDKHMQAYNTAL